MATGTPTIKRGAAGGDLNYEIITTYDIHEPEVRKELGMKVPKSEAFDWTRRLDGYMMPRKKGRLSVFSHYEEGEWFPASVVIAAKNTGTANTVIITLAAASHMDSGKRSYPRVGHVAIFRNGAQGYVSAVDKTSDNAHTVTIYDQNSNHDVQAAAVVGETMFFGTNQNEAGSKKVQGHIPNFEKVDHRMHIFREGMESDDEQLIQSGMWFDYKGSDKFYVKAFDDMMDRFKIQEQIAFLILDEADGVTGAQKGNPINTMKDALFPKIENEGINIEYTGSPGQALFEDVELMLNKFYGDSEYLVGMGLPAEQQLRNWLKTFTEYGDKGITFSGRSKQEVSIDFKSLKLGSAMFHFDTWNILTHPETLGATGMTYPWDLVFIPLGESKVYKDADMEKSENKKYFRIVYYQVPGTNLISDDVRKWYHGGAMDPATSDELVKGWNVVSYKTPELHCLNKFLRATKTDL